MNVIKNIQLLGSNNQPFLLDLYLKLDGKPKPIVIFVHGFKGFKDWGCWHLVARYFAENGFAFVKFNFSHNGTTIDNPTEFDDLEAFGNNNFEKELFDLGCVIDWIYNRDIGLPVNEFDRNNVFLLGHSRAAGIILLKAEQDNRVKKVVTWAGQTDFNGYFAELEDWKQKGVKYVFNGRTGQQMPLYWQFAENYTSNKEKFNIAQAVSKLNIPIFAVHGTNDQAVPLTALENLKKWNQNTKTLLMEGANHVFGAMHPCTQEQLPQHLYVTVTKTIEFLKNE